MFTARNCRYGVVSITGVICPWHCVWYVPTCQENEIIRRKSVSRTYSSHLNISISWSLLYREFFVVVLWVSDSHHKFQFSKQSSRIMSFLKSVAFRKWQKLCYHLLITAKSIDLHNLLRTKLNFSSPLRGRKTAHKKSGNYFRWVSLKSGCHSRAIMGLHNGEDYRASAATRW